MKKYLLKRAVASAVVACSTLPALSAAAEDIVIDRSLIISELAVLDHNDNFSLSKTMDQLAGQIQPTPLPMSGAELFENMFALQGSECSDTIAAIDGGGVEWPHLCDRQLLDGRQETEGDSHMSQYRTLALLNRFDAHDGSANDCGEYRIVYGRRSSNSTVGPVINGVVGNQSRTTIIFEAKMANPTPGDTDGCKPIQQFWANLAAVDDPEQRSDLLEEFFYQGLAAGGHAYPAVVTAGHFSEDPSLAHATGGQVRTNQFLNVVDPGAAGFGADEGDGAWVLKEYRFQGDAPFVRLDPVANTPRAQMFDENNQDPIAVEYRNRFLSLEGDGSIPNEGDEPSHLFQLMESNINKIALTVSSAAESDADFPRKFDFSESFSSSDPEIGPASLTVQNSRLAFEAAKLGPDGVSFLGRIRDRLESLDRLATDGLACDTSDFKNPFRLSSDVRNARGEICYSPLQIMNRANTQTCAGCHNPAQFGTVLVGAIGPIQGFPLPTGQAFTHIDSVTSNGGTTWTLSPALTGTFLPHRKRVVECLLNTNTTIEYAACREAL